MAENTKKELNDFQVRNIRILTHLLASDAVSDEVIEFLRLAEIDYFNLLDKYTLLEMKINIDEKTSLLKFRKDYLTSIIKTASRIYFGIAEAKYPLCFARFDIDDFAVFNNQYGHDTGDRVLVRVASLLRKNSRPTDYLIRFGGDEFDVILPATSMGGGKVFLDKIYDKSSALTVETDSGEAVPITLSCGMTSHIYTFEKNARTILSDDVEGLYDILQKQADDALYESKMKGKNAASIYDESKKKEYKKFRQQYAEAGRKA